MSADIDMRAAYLLAGIAGDESAAQQSAKAFVKAVRARTGLEDAFPRDEVKAVEAAVLDRAVELFREVLEELLAPLVLEATRH